MATIIDGKAAADALVARVAAGVERFAAARGRAPGLAVVLVGENPASEVYVRSKARRTREAGMRAIEHRLPATTTEPELLALVAALNADPEVDGILVQLPLPPAIDAARVTEAIDPAKDVDGFHPVNVGRLAAGGPALVPCTPLGCMMLIRSVRPDLRGVEAVVLGRSGIVGKPMAQLLLAADATVTIAHSRTRDLARVTGRAEVLVAAVGRPGLVTAAMVRPGAIVIDVGINRVPGADGRDRLVGDVDFASVAAVADAITPVPGGVGPMTVACLLHNALVAAARRAGCDPAVLLPG